MEELGKLWLKVKPIKSRCHNVTTREIQMVDELVNMFKKINPSIHLKVSGCNIPHIVSTIGKHLIQHNLIDSFRDTELKKQSYQPKF